MHEHISSAHRVNKPQIGLQCISRHTSFTLTLRGYFKPQTEDASAPQKWLWPSPIVLHQITFHFLYPSLLTPMMVLTWIQPSLAKKRNPANGSADLSDYHFKSGLQLSAETVSSQLRLSLWAVWERVETVEVWTKPTPSYPTLSWLSGQAA